MGQNAWSSMIEDSDRVNEKFLGSEDAPILLGGIGLQTSISNQALIPSLHLLSDVESAFDSLNWAAEAGDLAEIVRLLDEENPFKSMKKSTLKSDGSLLQYTSPLHIAAGKGDVDMMSYLINQGADVNAQDKRGLTPLMKAAEKNRFAAFQHLINCHADCDKMNKRGEVALHIACACGSLEIVKHLVENESHADVNIKDFNGCTPMYKAVVRNQRAVFDYLLADPRTDCRTRDKDDALVLHIAASFGNMYMVKRLIGKDTGLNDYHRDGYGKHTLHWAAHYGRMQIVRFLVEETHVPGDVTDNHYYTPLHEAARGVSSLKAEHTGGADCDHLAVVMYLTNTDVFDEASVECCVNMTNKYNDSALLIAATSRNVSVGLQLIKFCSIRTILEAARREPNGMKQIMLSLQHFYSSNKQQLNKTKSMALDHRRKPDKETSFVMRYSRTYVQRMLRGRKKDPPEYMVAEYELPIKFPCSIQFLSACLFVSESLEAPEIFENEVIACVVNYMWADFGLAYHLGNSGLFAAELILVAVSNYYYHDWVISSDRHTRDLASGVLIAIVILDALFLMVEVNQVYKEIVAERSLRYLGDIQNLFDWASHALVMVGVLCRLNASQETVVSSSAMAIGTFFLYLKLLYYFRPFQISGAVIRMLYFIFYKVFFLLVILGFIIFGFAQSMYLLSYHDLLLDFASPGNGYLNAFLYMMGNVSSLDNMNNSTNPSLAKLLLSLFLMISTILVLNVLIALMNSSYQTIALNRDSEWKRQRAKIMAEQFRPWLHFRPIKPRKFAYCISKYVYAEDDTIQQQQDQKPSISQIESKRMWELLIDPSHLSCMYAVVPEQKNTPQEQVRESCVTLYSKLKLLPADCYVVYDIQNETGRSGKDRPFAIHEYMSTLQYAHYLQQASGKRCIVYKPVSMDSADAVVEWANSAKSVEDVDSFVFVGATSKSATGTSAVITSVTEASTAASRKGIRFGAVLIFDRHDEFENILSKIQSGAQWFISQALFDSTAAIKLINKYGEECRLKFKTPKKIILTFLPCSNVNTLNFIRWLGVFVPPAVETRIFHSSTNMDANARVKESVDVLCEVFLNILNKTRVSGVPLGINVESLTRIKAEVNASYWLFIRLKGILVNSRTVSVYEKLSVGVHPDSIIAENIDLS